MLCVAACTPQSEHALYTVEAYRADKQLRQVQVARCKSDPGTLGKSPDCLNALEAERLEGIGSFRELPPLKLSPVAPAEQPEG